MSRWLQFQLPFPPSNNRYYRNVNGRMIISREGREYATRVAGIIQTVTSETFLDGIVVNIKAHMPDKRRRDVDNMLKVPLDAMQKAGVYGDDSQIIRLAIEKVYSTQPGRLDVLIESID
jgi:crossover junction endodeoxyribonuclease RusA